MDKDQIVNVIDFSEWAGLAFADDEKVFMQKISDVVNRILPGLAMYVRDVNLPDEIANKYKPDMIIMEKAFVDASWRVMGMVTTHRYAILSNHMISFEAYEAEDAKRGMYVANLGSHFLVLEVHEYSGKTLILLLHLPDDDDWKMFQTVSIGNLKEELVASSIERFENKCNIEAVPELTTDEWLDRCSFPLGIDSEGNFHNIYEKLVFVSEHEWTIIETRRVLEENREWRERYASYADAIKDNEPFIKTMRSRLREWSPLKLYLSVSSAVKAKTKVLFSLRYLGQIVADLACDEEKVLLSTKRYETTNLRDFDCPIALANASWKEKNVGEFRSHFKNRPEKRNKGKKSNDEHRVESLLLNEFSKTAEKTVRNIRSVEIAGVRFPMPTPLKASSKGEILYSGEKGGGVDILARVGTSGRNTRLCIMELKDENTKKEPAEKVLAQAIKYAVFIRELLRSDAGEAWYKLFGFSGKIPEKLVLNAVCVMPDIEGADTSFAGEALDIDGDTIELHYMYFKEAENKIVSVKSSLPIDVAYEGSDIPDKDMSDTFVDGLFACQDTQTGLWGAINEKSEWVILPIHDSEETLHKIEYVKKKT